MVFLRRRCLLLGGLALALPSRGEGRSGLAGTWKLNDKDSSDLTPVLDHYGAGFFVRRVATTVSPTNVITLGAQKLELDVRALGTSRKSTLVFDGATPTRDDLFGNPYVYTSVLDGEAVVSHGHVTHGDEEDALAMRRFLTPKGQMVLEMTIRPPKGKPLEVRRVFDRVEG